MTLETLPTAAESRAFFAEHDKNKAKISNNEESFYTEPPEYYYSKEILNKICEIEGSDDRSNSCREIFKLCYCEKRIIAGLTKEKESIRSTVIKKLDVIRKLLYVPPRSDWKPSPRAIADQDPMCLIDCLTDLLVLVTSTSGLWSLNELEAAELAADFDELITEIHTCQERIIQHHSKSSLKMTLNPNELHNIEAKSVDGQDNTKNDISMLVNVIGNLLSHVSLAIRYSLESSSSLLGSGEVGCPDPLISAICATNLSHGSIIPSTVTKGCQEISNNSVSCDQVSRYIKTVHALETSTLGMQILGSSEMNNVISALQGIRSGLHEYAKQRAFEWESSLAHSRLPHCLSTLPKSLVLAQTNDPENKTPGVSIATRLPSDPPYASESSALDNTRHFIRYKLGCLSHALAGVYKIIGSAVGGYYGDPRIQQQFISSTVLGLYVSLVGFLFIDDLKDLAKWLKPILPNVRQQLMHHNNNVSNAEQELEKRYTSQNTTTTLPQECSGVNKLCKSEEHTKVLLSILNNPTELMLARHNEAEEVLRFFVPDSKPYLNQFSSSDQIDPVLVWLAWEGDLLNLYYLMSAATKTSCDTECKPMEQDKVVEDAIVALILNGAESVRAKLSEATDLFASLYGENKDVSCPLWNGTGEDIIQFCTRVLESLSLRYKGEIETNFSNAESLHSDDKSGLSLDVAKWKVPLLHSLLMTKKSDTGRHKYKLVEGAPKFLAEFTHQTLFYRCPLHPLTHVLPDAVGVSASVSSANAVTCRLAGVISDLETRITGSEFLGEAAILNTHHNKATISELEKLLAGFKAQFQAHVEGIADRHSHQIRGHSNRLEVHQKDIRQTSGILATQQVLLNNLAQDLKKIGDGSLELKLHFESVKAAAEKTALKSDNQQEWADKLASVEAFCKDRLEELESKLRTVDKTVRKEQDEFMDRAAKMEEHMKNLNYKVEDTLELCNESAIDKKIQNAVTKASDFDVASKCEEAINNQRGNMAVIEEKIEGLNTLYNGELIANIANNIVSSSCNTTDGMIYKTIEKALKDCNNDTVLKTNIAEAATSIKEELVMKDIKAAAAAYTDEILTQRMKQYVETFGCACNNAEALDRVEKKAAVHSNTANLERKIEELAAKSSADIANNQAKAQASIKDLKHEIDQMKSSLEEVQHALKQHNDSLVDAVLQRTRKDLSSYLNDCVAHCVTKHVNHLNEQEQQKRRFLAWTIPVSPRTTNDKSLNNNNNNSTVTTSNDVSNPKYTQSTKQNTVGNSISIPLNRLNHRPSGQEEFDGLADNVSVMEEDTVLPEGFDKAWFPHDTTFLDLPNAANPDRSLIVGTVRPGTIINKKNLPIPISRSQLGLLSPRYRVVDRQNGIIQHQRPVRPQ